MELNFPPEYLPKHIAIIMDGNGRWASAKNKPRIWGHREGSKTVKRITEECARLGISQLTLYAFSSENWQRPPQEVSYLMTLLRRFLIKERQVVMANNIRLEAVGRLERLPPSILRELEITRAISSGNTGMVLCLAISYGGRTEILDAVKSIARQVAAGVLSAEAIDEQLFAKNLYQPEMPPVDLLIRTGGELRISNFLLWQLSYTELWVTPVRWPEFQIADLHQAIFDFAGRERRFGKVAGEVSLSQIS